MVDEGKVNGNNVVIILLFHAGRAEMSAIFYQELGDIQPAAVVSLVRFRRA